jgi:hypothetical protein
MQKNQLGVLRPIALACTLLASTGSQAYTFETESVKGSFDSTISIGTGIRMKSPSCSLVTAGATGPGAPEGCLAPTSMLGDQGNLNYGKHDAFTTYIKGNHELLLKMPGDWTGMGRVNWVRDFTATHTTGIISGATPLDPTTGGIPPDLADGQAASASESLRTKTRLLDLWVSKSFQVGEQQARVRVGNQVISWGESLFLPGGINSTNAMDIMRLSQPGTQLKEVFLAAPMVSVASGVAPGVNVEAYVQTNWNKSYFPPTGSYWSVVNGLGKGADAYGLADVDARNTGQWGAAVKWEPRGTQLNLGAYFLNYHDKTPNFSYNIHNTGTVGWTYAEDRKLYGVSANFPVGDWAIGTELSYRPKDAVALNALSFCTSQGGNCWVDEKRFQWHLTGLWSLTPNGSGGGLLRAIGAQTGTLLAEAVVIRYPNLQQTYGGDPIAAGGWGWGTETDPTAAMVPVGSKTSSGINFDFSVVYDGTVVPGWQMTPGVYYFQALSGRTPNASALFMKGAKSANFYLNFAQNPATWQFGLNYAIFRGGSSPFDQPLADRDYIGMYLSRNF